MWKYLSEHRVKVQMTEWQHAGDAKPKGNLEHGWDLGCRSLLSVSYTFIAVEVILPA